MVSSEIRYQFSKYDLVKLMSIIHNHFWSSGSVCMSSIYKKYIGNLLKHFYQHVDINRLKILGILMKKEFNDQSHQH